MVSLMIINTVDFVRLKKKEDIPGPGQYKPKTEIDKLGIYFLSNLE